MAKPTGGPSAVIQDGHSSARPHGVERFPEDRSILWTPLEEQARDSLHRPYALVLEQSVLRDLRDQVASRDDGEVGGVLAGRLLECPDTKRKWVKIEEVLPSETALAEDADAPELEAVLQPLRARAGAGKRRLAGWYHSHTLLGVFLSERDAQIHRRLFAEPWQCALVVVDRSGRPSGGLFQCGPQGGLRRSLYVPFFELLEDSSVLEDGGLLTWMDWSNYETADRRVRPAPAPMIETNGGPKGGQRDSEPESLPAPKADPPPPASAERDEPYEVPLILPGADAEWLAARRRRRLRWLARIGLPLLLAAAGYFGWTRFGPTANRPAPAPRDPSPVATTPAATATPGTPAPTPAAGFEATLARFFGAGDGYQERRSDYDLGRIDCASLAIGYQAVDEAFLALSAAFGAARPTAAQESSYGDAGESMDAIDRHFDASGCPRPE